MRSNPKITAIKNNINIDIVDKWKWWDGNVKGHFGQSSRSRCRETDTVPGFSGGPPLQRRVLLERDKNGKQVESRRQKGKGFGIWLLPASAWQ